MTFYAYLHARPDSVDAAGVFYVGKGKGKRCYDLNRKNPHHRNVIAKYGKSSILVSKIECSSEASAFDLEVGLIKCLKRMGVSLCNKTVGGDGVRGYVRTEAWRKQHSATMKGKPSPTKGKAMTEAQKRKISESLKKNNYWLGKTHTDEAKAKMGVNTETVWVNNGITRLRVQKSQVDKFLSEGFVLGIKFNR